MAKKINKTSLLGLGQFQVSYKWDLEIIRRPAIFNVIDENVLRSIVKSLKVPGYTQDTAEVMLRGHKWDEPMITNTNGDWEFTAMELESSPLRKLAVAWQNALKSNTLNRNAISADFKLTSKTRSEKENHMYIIKNFYPVTVQCPDFSGEGQLYEINISGKFMDLDIKNV